MEFNNLCEMDVSNLIQSVIGKESEGSPYDCSVEAPIQPNDNVGQFGNTPEIQVKITEDGGVEINSKELAIKLSKEVFDALKSFVGKEEEE